MYSPEAFQRALMMRQGQGPDPLGGMPDVFEPDMFNPDAQLDTSRMQDIPYQPPVIIPGTEFEKQQQPDILQMLMAFLGQQ